MAYRYTDYSLATVSLIFLFLVDLILGCSPTTDNTPPPLENKGHFSDVVVWGTVMEILEDSVYGHYDSTYAVRFKVKCSFKGGRIPATITINGAGSVPGLCHRTNLTTNNDYFLFLSHSNNRYEPIYEEYAYNEQNIDEILSVCEFESLYPEGVNKDSLDYVCDPTYEDDCLKYEPPTDATPEVQGTDGDKETKYQPGTPEPEGKVASASDGNSGGVGKMHMFSLGVATVCMVLAAIIV